jgi:hypothetical protein
LSHDSAKISQRRMATTALSFALYAAAMFLFAREERNGLWALAVCFALTWGALEHRRNGRQPVTPDPQSRLRLN